MPYKIVKTKNGWKVVGRTRMWRHRTKKSALAQLRALYANVPDAKQKKKYKKNK